MILRHFWSNFSNSSWLGKKLWKIRIRWIKTNFGCRRPSILTDEIKKELEQRILVDNNLNMDDVQRILAYEMDINFSLTYFVK